MTKGFQGAALWLLLLLAPVSKGAEFFSGLFTDEPAYLSADEAFVLEVDGAAVPGSVALRWAIEEDYYLYRRQFAFEIEGQAAVQLGAASFPPGSSHVDEFFGEQEVYYGEAAITLPVTGEPGTPFTLQVRYQGCADAGLCYPPQVRRLELQVPLGVAASAAAPPATPGAPNASATAAPGASTTSVDTASRFSASDAPAVGSARLNEQDKLARFISQSRLATVLLAFTGFGLLLAFTPCVLPMVPILSSIILGQKDVGMRRAFLLSSAYVLAMAATYTAAGVGAGLLGANLQIMFQNPWVLGTFAGVFVLLALSMFGFFELQMPLALQQRLGRLSDRQQGGTLGGAAVMGMLSALIVGPCVAAPMAGALMVIGQSGDPLRGGLALFALGIGMGLPLIALGVGFGKALPRTGAWMAAVKAVFGVLLLALALYLVGRVLPSHVSVALWALLAIVSSVYLGAFAAPANTWQKAWKGLGLVLFGWGILLIIGLASGRADLLTPLRALAAGQGPVEEHLAFTPIKSVADLERTVSLAAEGGQPVMLDFYADWCIACKEMERYTFSDPEVQEALAGAMLLQADVTANDAEDQALLARFGLYGPPGIIFFDGQGQELHHGQVVGFQRAAPFLAHLERLGFSAP